jgi:hypothetical protein
MVVDVHVQVQPYRTSCPRVSVLRPHAARLPPPHAPPQAVQCRSQPCLCCAARCEQNRVWEGDEKPAQVLARDLVGKWGRRSRKVVKWNLHFFGRAERPSATRPAAEESSRSCCTLRCLCLEMHHKPQTIMVAGFLWLARWLALVTRLVMAPSTNRATNNRKQSTLSKPTPPLHLPLFRQAATPFDATLFFNNFGAPSTRSLNPLVKVCGM